MQPPAAATTPTSTPLANQALPRCFVKVISPRHYPANRAWLLVWNDPAVVLRSPAIRSRNRSGSNRPAHRAIRARSRGKAARSAGSFNSAAIARAGSSSSQTRLVRSWFVYSVANLFQKILSFWISANSRWRRASRFGSQPRLGPVRSWSPFFRRAISHRSGATGRGRSSSRNSRMGRSRLIVWRRS